MENKKIDQGLERLYTVRPRSMLKESTRGDVSSIVFNLPKGTNRAKWAAGVDSNIQSTFEKAISVDGFVNFIAKSVSYDIQEKSQVLHTFGGKEAVYFFGKAPIQVNFSGLLIDDIDNQQFSQFLNLYRNYLSGTQASQEYCYITLRLNNAEFTGAFTGIQIQQDSSRDTDVTFSAQFLAKTFAIATVDSVYFNKDDNKNPVLFIRDVDPTITQETIDAVQRQQEENDGYSLSVSNYTKTFSTLPPLSDYLKFSASDINNFFNNINDFIDNVTKPIQDLANQIDGYANDIIGLVEAVENGIDSIVNNVDSAVKSVYGVKESLEDVVTTICNFPNSITNKLGSIGSSGVLSAPKIAGSDSISSDAAMFSLSTAQPVGSARGTPDGAAAVLAVLSSSNVLPPLSSTPPGEEEEPPSLPIRRIGG